MQHPLCNNTVYNISITKSELSVVNRMECTQIYSNFWLQTFVSMASEIFNKFILCDRLNFSTAIEDFT